MPRGRPKGSTSKKGRKNGRKNNTPVTPDTTSTDALARLLFGDDDDEEEVVVRVPPPSTKRRRGSDIMVVQSSHPQEPEYDIDHERVDFIPLPRAAAARARKIAEVVAADDSDSEYGGVQGISGVVRDDDYEPEDDEDELRDPTFVVEDDEDPNAKAASLKELVQTAVLPDMPDAELGTPDYLLAEGEDGKLTTMQKLDLMHEALRRADGTYVQNKRLDKAREEQKRIDDARKMGYIIERPDVQEERYELKEGRVIPFGAEDRSIEHQMDSYARQMRDDWSGFVFRFDDQHKARNSHIPYKIFIFRDYAIFDGARTQADVRRYYRDKLIDSRRIKFMEKGFPIHILPCRFDRATGRMTVVRKPYAQVFPPWPYYMMIPLDEYQTFKETTPDFIKRRLVQYKPFGANVFMVSKDKYTQKGFDPYKAEAYGEIRKRRRRRRRIRR